MTLAVAVKCLSGSIYRNVRSLDDIKKEFEDSSIHYVHVPPSVQKMGSWEIVLVFENTESFDQYKKGELRAPWDLGEPVETKIINPLKASKRAAKRG